MRDIDCYLFDLDGTLVDSSPVHDRVYREVLGREHPERLAVFDYRAISGLTTLDAFRTLGLDDDQVRHCTALKQERYRQAVEAGAVQAIAGAGIVLKMLKARGASIAVVTSASRASAVRTLETTGLMAHVDALVTADDVTQTKPAPEPYLRALAQMKAESAATAVVEDAPAGIASARAAGLTVIGVHESSVCALSDIYFADFAAFADALP